MRFHPESERDAYDVVVIGSGIGGLTAAALLARAGRSVLVVERHDRPGGYAHGFRRRGCQFDSAVHLVGGGGGGGFIERVLRSVDAHQACEFVRVDPFYATLFPGFRLTVPTGIDAFIDAHAQAFPRERDGLRALLDESESIYRLKLSVMARHADTTLAEALDTHLQDNRLKSVVASLWPYLGLPPSRLSFAFWSMMLHSYLDEGAWFCRGGFQRFADALAGAVRGHGGEVLLRSVVRRITVDQGRATGVVLENGQRIRAGAVLSNADATQTFEELLGVEAPPMTPSVSAFVVYCGMATDPHAAGLEHEMFVYDTWDHDEDFRNLMDGRISRVGITVPTLSDPSLAPSGTHLMTITALFPHDLVRSWRDAKSSMTDALLARAEVAVPGLRDSLRFAEAGTPRTMERYTRNRAGAMYGWELTPAQVGPARARRIPAVDGLTLVGHWAAPGSGVYGVCQSGVNAAAKLLGVRADAVLA